jgi:hypothetical protein
MMIPLIYSLKGIDFPPARGAWYTGIEKGEKHRRRENQAS